MDDYTEEQAATHPYFDDRDIALVRQSIEINTEIATSPTLRYLFEQAKKDAEEAKSELLQVDPTNVSEIIRLQMIGMMETKLMVRLQELHEHARIAEERIHEEDASE